MISINLTPNWLYVRTPKAGFRANFADSGNKHTCELIPVVGVTPVTWYTVTDYNGRELYCGRDRVTAALYKAQYDNAQEKPRQYTPVKMPGKTARLTTSYPTLPTNGFRIIRTPTGHTQVVAGDDTTNRCLLFVGSDGKLIRHLTQGTILKECSASTDIDSICAIAILLNIGQAVVCSRRSWPDKGLYRYTWTGSELVRRPLPGSDSAFLYSPLR